MDNRDRNEYDRIREERERFGNENWRDRENMDRNFGTTRYQTGESGRFSQGEDWNRYGDDPGRHQNQQWSRDRGDYGQQWSGERNRDEGQQSWGERESWRLRPEQRHGRESDFDTRRYGQDYREGSYNLGYGRERDFGQQGYGGQNWNQGYGQNWSQDYGQRWGQQNQNFGQRYGQQDYGRSSQDWGTQNRDWRSNFGQPETRDYGQNYTTRNYQDWEQTDSYGRPRTGSGSDFGSRTTTSTYGSRGEYGRGRDESLTERVGRFFGMGPKGYRRSDERIREDVSERLEDHPEIDATNIEVLVKDGEVTLSGSVDNRRAKRLAEDVAEQCRGVKDVHNQIHVTTETGTQETGTRTGRNKAA